MTLLSTLALLAALVIAGFILRISLKRPSNDRDWQPDAARMPEAKFDGERVTLRNVRNTHYPDPDEPYEVTWENRTYDLSKLKRLWFIVEPFHPTIKVIAHTLISFEFEDDFLALSIEARMEKNESYSIFKGLINEYELIYSFGTERDLIGRRALYQDHQIYLYPLVTPPREVRVVLEDMFKTANRLRDQPRFYNSVRHNCTSALRKHANRVRPGSFPAFILADVLPGLSDRVLFNKGWIDTELPFDELREHYGVKSRVEACDGRDDFSRCIRVELDV